MISLPYYEWKLLLKWYEYYIDIFQICSIMDRYLREACEKWIVQGVLDKKVLDTSEKRENFKKFCRSLSVQDDVLMYKGRSASVPKVVPTPEQVWVVLHPVHLGAGGKHVGTVQTLVNALSEAGYAFPIGHGGLAALVKE